MGKFFDDLRAAIAATEDYDRGGAPSEGVVREYLLRPDEATAGPTLGDTPPTTELEAYRDGAWHRTGIFSWHGDGEGE